MCKCRRRVGDTRAGGRAGGQTGWRVRGRTDGRASGLADGQAGERTAGRASGRADEWAGGRAGECDPACIITILDITKLEQFHLFQTIKITIILQLLLI